MMLDLESVRLFVLAARHGNLTRAAEAAGTVQPVVSQRIKALEARLERRLLDRTPRFVRLTEAGSLFLERAESLLAAHEAALGSDREPGRAIGIGVSDHLLGTRFDEILRRLREGLPAPLTLAVRLGQSQHLRQLYDDGDLDIVLLRQEGGPGDGETIGKDALRWYGPPGWVRPTGPLPLILLPPPCGVRAAAVNLLDRVAIPWREAFVGGSCMALAAAVRAGLGVAPLGSLAGADLSRLAPRSELPDLPASRVTMLARTPNARLAAAARVLAASVRETLQDAARR